MTPAAPFAPALRPQGTPEMRYVMTTRPVGTHLLALLLLGTLALGCTRTPAVTATPTRTSTVTPTGTPTPAVTSTAAPTGTVTGTATASTTPGAGTPPTNVRLEGRLPDLSTPVPPGEGEAGRLTVLWDGGTGARGFRVYLKECDGTVRPPIEVPASDHRFGPLQACRPTGNIGVSAVYAGGESAIAWVR